MVAGKNRNHPENKRNPGKKGFVAGQVFIKKVLGLGRFQVSGFWPKKVSGVRFQAKMRFQISGVRIENLKLENSAPFYSSLFTTNGI